MTDHPQPTAQVLRFRPRSSDQLDPPTEIQARGPDDFRDRMLANVAGFACAVVLTLAGIWLASSISDLRQKQDCVLSGRRNCAPIAVVPQAPLARQH